MKKNNIKNFLSVAALSVSLVMVSASFIGCSSDSKSASESASDKNSFQCTTADLLTKAVEKATAGDTITINGTIKLTSTLNLKNSGSSGKYITLSGGTLDFTGMKVATSNRGIQLSGNYWKLSGVTVKNAGDNGVNISGNNNYLVNCNANNNSDSGFQIANGGANNTLDSCKATGNYDKDNRGENADGFACKQSNGPGNVFNGCTATANSDDGWDLYSAPFGCSIIGCTAVSNGKDGNGDGNGFKLGSKLKATTGIVVKKCTANSNKGWGYTRNGNTASINFSENNGEKNGKGLQKM